VNQLILVLFVLVILYLLFLRPRMKGAKTNRRLGLQPGDDVVSNSGIFGVVTKVYDQRVYVEIAPEVEVIFDRRALTHLDGVIVDAMEEAEAKFDEINFKKQQASSDDEKSFEGGATDNVNEPKGKADDNASEDDDEGGIK
jgi:preprotein translocase subunit YajC